MLLQCISSVEYLRFFHLLSLGVLQFNVSFETDCPAWKNHVAKSFPMGLISYRITYSANAAFLPVCACAAGKGKRQSRWQGKGPQECIKEHFSACDFYIGGLNI